MIFTLRASKIWKLFLRSNILMIIITLWPLFGTIGKLCLSTFRITLSFSIAIEKGELFEMVTEASSFFSTPIFVQIKMNLL